MSEGFRGPDLKLRRAKSHIDDLGILLDRFLNAQSYKVVADLNLEPGNVCWVAHGKDTFPPDEFGPIIGDAIHNMRDALDIAVSVIMRNAGESDKGVYFPQASSRSAFQDSIAKGPKKPNFPQNLIDVLQTKVKPYTGGDGFLLRKLHNLAIMDKHRLIIPTVFGARIVYIATEGIHLPAHVGTPEPIKDGEVVIRLRASEFPAIKSSQEALIDLTIAFDKRSGMLGAGRVDSGLQRLYEATESAIDSMRICLP